MAAERILVCDDDPQIRRALSLILREAGYEVLITSTGRGGARRAPPSTGPHLAIVDLLLPDQHGIEVCQRLREWSEMPILVLSAISDEQTKIDALEHGADDYVTKPFGPGELVARVKAALRRAGPGRERAAHRDRWLDRRSGRARRVASTASRSI